MCSAALSSHWAYPGSLRRLDNPLLLVLCLALSALGGARFQNPENDTVQGNAILDSVDFRPPLGFATVMASYPVRYASSL